MIHIDLIGFLMLVFDRKQQKDLSNSIAYANSKLLSTGIIPTFFLLGNNEVRFLLQRYLDEFS